MRIRKTCYFVSLLWSLTFREVSIQGFCVPLIRLTFLPLNRLPQSDHIKAQFLLALTLRSTRVGYRSLGVYRGQAT